MSSSSGTSAVKPQLQRVFNRVNDSDVFVSHPPKTADAQGTGSEKAPSVILIFGWMDAQLPHLYKYTEKYHQMYPSAAQILIRTHQKYFWKGEAAQRAAISPAMKLLRDSGISPNNVAESSGLLVHTFSNGGALAETSLANCLAESAFPAADSTSSSHSALPAQAFVYDSLPGVLSLGITITAFTAPIRSAPLRAIAQVVFGTAYIVVTAWRYTFGALLGQGPDKFTLLHRELNDSRLIPHHVPRTYIYSDVDELIPAESVEGHAKKTKELLEKEGLDSGLVRLVKFEGASHVAHARKDPKRYWETVVQTWEASYRK
ncbi:hypothetical protein BDV93DRAFT_526185 [Ceratobasidium sp. AG-I]|nr:hypothetical protein BDV93DRAFT_526185 [Ceratobasidium sp. AG-I]